MPVATVRSFARAGIVSAQRGSRREYRFSFQDVVVLRTAKELAGAHIHPRKIWRALRILRHQLPSGQSLTALRIAAQGDQIIVRDNRASWRPESGQITFEFSVSEMADEAACLAQDAAQIPQSAEDMSSDDWYNLGIDLEAVTATNEAKKAYQFAIQVNPHNSDAYVNLGRLLHEEGRLAEAEAHYRRAIGSQPNDATAAFNLGITLEDLSRPEQAVDSYNRAIKAQPNFADAHYNLARLYERLGDRAAALRHLARYKILADQ